MGASAPRKRSHTAMTAPEPDRPDAPTATHIGVDVGADAPTATHIGVDVGATKTAVAAGTADGRLLAKRVVPTVLRDPAALADAVADAIAELRAAVAIAPDAPIGIGVCGGVGRDGLVAGPIALGWSGRVDFAGLVAERTGARTAIDNDVNAGAIAEHRWGAGRGVDDFVYLAIGTGIGAGLFLGGALHRGARHLAGEIGHLSVDVDGEACACGNRGCLEATCGGKAAAERVAERLRLDPGLASVLRAVQAARGGLTARDLFDTAAAGDAFARAEVVRMARHLAAAIVGVVNLLDVARVIVGGGQAQHAVVLPTLRAALRDWRPYLDRGDDWLVPAGLGEDAGVAGALALAVEADAALRAPGAAAPPAAATEGGVPM